MKKLFSILCILLILVGCAKEDSTLKPDLDNEFVVETYQVDMSGYQNIKSNGHMFKGTTVSELKRTIDEKGYGVFVLSRVGCSFCQLAMQHLNSVAEELGVYVYYIDAESEAYPILGTDDFDVLENALLETLEEDEDGEKVIQTPEVFTIVDGLITSYQIGTTWTGGEPSDSDIEKLKDTYRKMLTPFAK